MDAALTDVYAFQCRFEHQYDGPPRLPERDLATFRLRFLGEELRELGAALGFHVEIKITEPEVKPALSSLTRRADALDALVDLDYVLKGTVLQLGFGEVYGEAWRRVHAANLAKVPGVKATRGFQRDVIKPPGWVPPDHTDLVALKPASS